MNKRYREASKKLGEKGYVTGPNWVHISTIPLLLGKKPFGEADSASTQVAQLRKKESRVDSEVVKPSKVFKFRETSTDNYKNHIFKVVLIKEGLGNFRDRFFYSKQALQNAASSKIFDGCQAYVDHPTMIDEEIRPERSTKDIAGYYQNIQYQESEDGQGELVGDLCVATTISQDWIMSLLTNSVDYSNKFKERDLMGLSINASGPAESMGLEEFINSQKVSDPVLAKLVEARSQGITEINVVNELTEVQSVDLVTKAGAGGRVQRMVEGGKKNGKA